MDVVVKKFLNQKKNGELFHCCSNLIGKYIFILFICNTPSSNWFENDIDEYRYRPCKLWFGKALFGTKMAKSVGIRHDVIAAVVGDLLYLAHIQD